MGAVISEAHTCYSYDRSSWYALLDKAISKARAVLHLTMGGQDDAVRHAR